MCNFYEPQLGCEWEKLEKNIKVKIQKHNHEFLYVNIEMIMKKNGFCPDNETIEQLIDFYYYMEENKNGNKRTD